MFVGTSRNKSFEKNTPCRHSDRCFTADCPYKHPSEWCACKYGVQCNDFDCTANHPPNRKDICKYGNGCRKYDCSCLHPKPNKSKHVYQNDDHNYDPHTQNSPDRSKTRTNTQHSHFQSDNDDVEQVRYDNFYYVYLHQFKYA